MNARQLIEDEMDDKDEILAGRPDAQPRQDERTLDPFTVAYMEAALFLTTNENASDGRSLNRDYSEHDLANRTYKKMIEDCASFQKENADDLATGTPERGGHDFWLTRNGHGSGFWAGDWPDDAGERLSAAAERYGETWIYLGDDGRIHS